GSCGADPQSIQHRGECLDAAWLSLYGGFNTGLGLSHAVGHQIGPVFDIPHGITSCIALVPSMRLIGRDSPQTFAEIAQALRVPEGADQRATALASADAVATFIGQFDVPTRLTHFGVGRDQALRLAPAVLEELMHFNTMRRVVTLEEIRELLAE